MDSSTEQLCAILNRKWQPDDDQHALILDGGGHFEWVGEVTVGPDTPIKYEDDRPKPPSGEWSVEGTKLVLRSRLNKGRVEYAVEHNADGDELTLTGPDGRSRRFTRASDTEIEHPSRAARRTKFGLPPE